MSLEIHLTGAAKRLLAKPSEALLYAVAKTEPKRRKVIMGKELLRGDWVAVTALVLAVPGAITTSMDLMERAGITQKIRKLLAKTRCTDGTAILRAGSKPPLDLKEAVEDEVLDLMAKILAP
jgi:hypothetical protein